MHLTEYFMNMEKNSVQKCNIISSADIKVIIVLKPITYYFDLYITLLKKGELVSLN